MVQVGDKITFRPHAWLNVGEDKRWAGVAIPDKVTGTVVNVNEKTGTYRVEYEVHGHIDHETFKLPVSETDTPMQETSPTPGGYKSSPKGGRSPWWAKQRDKPTRSQKF